MANLSDLGHGEGLIPLTKTVAAFVGRTQQLNWLKQRLQEALAGHPRIVLLPGVAGIGKTRLLKEIQSFARTRGVQILYGRGYEDLTLPYLPFSESLLPYLENVLDQENNAFDVDKEIIDRLIRRGRVISPMSRPSVSARTDGDKLHLFLTVSHTTIQLAQSCPMLFIMDDLHWADHPSLELLSHLVFTVADTALRESIPLLVIGAYRPIESNERLNRLISRFQRETSCQTYELTGLDESEMSELVCELGVQRPSRQLIATLKEATQGNPLFIQEVVHYLRQRGALQKRGGYMVTTSSSVDLRLPGHITEALSTRIQRLSPECQHVLTVASLFGESFPVPLVSAVCNLSEVELLDRLEEALHQFLLINEGQEFQFAHPLIRHTLYHELSVARRQHFHWQIFQLLENMHMNALDAHVMELAHHLIRAGSIADMDKVMHYAQRAGDQAYALFAWGESARYYEAVLSAHESNHRLSAHQRADLHYHAGLARYRDMDVGPCRDHYEKAIQSYRLSNNMQGLAQVLVEKTRILFSLDSIPWGTLIDLQPLEDVFAALGDTEPGLCGNIAAVMAEAYRMGGQPDKAEAVAQQALDIAQRIYDDSLSSRASHVLALAQNQNMKLLEAVENWQNALTYARRTDDLWYRVWPLQRLSWTLMQMAKLEDAEAIALDACDLAQKTQDWGDHSLALAALVSMAVTRGDFDLAERHGQEVMSMMHRSRYPWGGARALFTLACARLSRGDWAGAESALNMLAEPGGVFEKTGSVIEGWIRVYRQLLHAHMGGSVEATVEQLADNMLQGGDSDLYNLAPLCALVEIGALTASLPLASRPYQVLARAMERGVLFSSWWVFLLPRILGVVATLHGWWDQAEVYFQTAMDIAMRAGAKPELGRTYLDYARMLVARDGRADRQRALEWVRHAAPIFAELGMHPFISQTHQLTEAIPFSTSLENIQPDTRLDDFSEQEVAALLHIVQHRTSFLG